MSATSPSAGPSASDRASNWRSAHERLRAWARRRWLVGAATLGVTALVSGALSWGLLIAWAEGVPEGAPPAGEVVAIPSKDVIGTLGGGVAVGASGGASWTTVLKVVPGVGGLQPGVSIGYGGGGYGGLGVGFSLSAGGAISRCRETLGQDGQHAPVRWTQAAPLCLDGARLVAVSGEHGAAGTEYRVQSAPNVRVRAVGASTEAASGFAVYTPDNRVTHYGVAPSVAWTAESVQWARIGGALVPFSWHIARVIDRKTQNQMRYRYAGEAVAGEGVMTPGDHRLAGIEYGINPSGGTDATRQVRFEYAAVQDLLGEPAAWEGKAWVHQGYVAGMAYTRRQVLTRVEMQVHAAGAWQAVRQYRLGYEPVPDGVPDASSPDRVRLATLQECAPTRIDEDHGDGSWGSDQTPCFGPTRFEWSQAATQLVPLTGFGFDAASFYPLPPASELKTQVYERVGMQVVGDFDGDGDEDFLVMPERMNAPETPLKRWELWRTDPDVHAPTTTNIPTWGAQGAWVNRAGTVVPQTGGVTQAYWPGAVRPPEAVQTGYRRDEKAVPGAWAVNYDGTGGTDVLLGEPVLELAGAKMDTPWGMGGKTGLSRGDHCPLVQPTPEEYWACQEQHLDRSKADYLDHPGFLRGLKVLRLRSAQEATFVETALQLPEGQVLFYAQPLDVNGDALTDVMFCKSDADYAAAAGQALPMFYGAGGEFDPVNWVSGRMYYALNVPGQGIDLSGGGLPATSDGGLSHEPVPCHAKDSYLVLDLHGDGRQSLLQRTHQHVQQLTLDGIAPNVPAGVVNDPYPKDPNQPQLTGYWQKNREKVWAEHPIGETTYAAFTYEGGTGMTYGPTGLPYEAFMRWQRGGNTQGRYSTHQGASVSDDDGGVSAEQIAFGIRDGRLTDWGGPGALMVGGGPSELRTGDVNGDGLSDVLMVDLLACHYGQVQNQAVAFPARTCSFQDVAEFGTELIEQTYEKLAVFVYLNRGDGTFDLGSTHKLWDTDLDPAEKQLLETGYVQGLNAIAQDALYQSAWTKATAATRGWRMEFASSLIGDGNGDGLADLGYLRMAFDPSGGWIGDSMAGTYTMTPVWRLGRQGGGLAEAETPMGLDIADLVPASAPSGWPGWQQDLMDNATTWEEPGEAAATLGPYAQHEYGLAARLMQLDVDHDGRAELVFYDHVRGQWLLATPEATDEPQPHLLVAVTDGLGARTEVDYAPQWTLTSPEHPWTQGDLDLPYPLVSRPSTAAAVARLRNDSGQDAGNAPLYTTTQYLYGKSLADVRHGIALGIDRHVAKRSTATPSGTVNSLRVERYDTTPDYAATFKAYPLAGTLLSSTAMVWGEPGTPVRLSHSGQRHSAQAGVKPGTWRRQLDASTTTSYEVGDDVPASAAGTLFSCLIAAYDGAQQCALGPADSYQPLSHSTSALGYDGDGYGLVKTQIVAAAGSTSVTQRAYAHHDPVDLDNPGGYVLGLPTTEWVAHEPQPGVGYTLRTVVSDYFFNGQLQSTTIEPERPQYRVKESYTYGEFGHLKTKTVSAAGSPDNVTGYGYTASGAYLASVTNALDQSTTTGWFEGCGVPEHTTNALGQTVVHDIDELCRDSGAQTFFGALPLDRKTRIRYAEWEPNANEAYPDREVWVSTEVDGGAKTHTIANRVGQVLVSQAPGFGFEVYTQTRYDALGRVHQVSLPTPVGKTPSGWTTTTHDAHGRAVQRQKPDGTTQGTAYAREVTTATNELGHSGRSQVNALGQVVKVSPPLDPNVPGPDLSMCYAYGAFGTLTEARPCVATAAKGPTTLRYDDYGRLIKSLDLQAGERQMRYDPLGRLDESEDAQGTVTKQRYDVLGRLVERIEAYNTPNAKSAVWVYDTLGPGLLSQATNAAGTVTQVPLLDEVNRVVGSTTTIHGRPYTQRQHYDSWGRVVARSYPSLTPLAPVQAWTQYNDYDQPIGLTQAGQLLWQPIQADVWGHLTEQRYGQALTATASYAPDSGRLQATQVRRKTWVNPNVYADEELEHYTYDWYDHGLIRQRTQHALTQTTTDQVDQFYYTPRGELAGWTTLGANQAVKQSSLSTDGFGNLTDTPSGHYSYQGEQLQKIEGPLGTLSYTYDGNGNVTTRSHQGGTTTLVYDALDRVAQIQDAQSDLTITYSADGAKVHVREAKTGRETIYLGAYQEERGGKLGAQVIGRYAFGPAHLTRAWGADLSYKDTLRYTPPADHLGSTTLVTDPSGAVKERRSYGVWGEERNPADWTAFQAAPQDELKLPNSGYTGTHERRQRGATAPGISGLIDMQARYYDPTAMRFLQPDTIVPEVFNPISWNRFTYANNSPVAFSDPTGHAPVNPDGSTVVDGAEMVARNDQDMTALLESRGFGYSSGGPAGAATGVMAGDLLMGMKARKPGGAHKAGRDASPYSKFNTMSAEEKFAYQAYLRDKGNYERAGMEAPFSNVEEYMVWRAMSREGQAMGINSQMMEEMANSADQAAGAVGFGAGNPASQGVRNGIGAASSGGPRWWWTRAAREAYEVAQATIAKARYARMIDLAGAYKQGRLDIRRRGGYEVLLSHGEEVGRIHDIGKRRVLELDAKYASVDNFNAALATIVSNRLATRGRVVEVHFNFGEDLAGASSFERNLRTAYGGSGSVGGYRDAPQELQIGTQMFLPVEGSSVTHYVTARFAVDDSPSILR